MDAYAVASVAAASAVLTLVLVATINYMRAAPNATVAAGAKSNAKSKKKKKIPKDRASDKPATAVEAKAPGASGEPPSLQIVEQSAAVLKVPTASEETKRFKSRKNQDRHDAVKSKNNVPEDAVQPKDKSRENVAVLAKEQLAAPERKTAVPDPITGMLGDDDLGSPAARVVKVVQPVKHAELEEEEGWTRTKTEKKGITTMASVHWPKKKLERAGVLRIIGSSSAAKASLHETSAGSEEVTRKQRENQRKADRLKAEKQANDELQAERIRNHRRQQEREKLEALAKADRAKAIARERARAGAPRSYTEVDSSWTAPKGGGIWD
ncbi:hypothetical protein HK101_005033 [Irineochytrium annulatum]|nr:hypothetical protein HK101_005033 [Irineochytrium annulatum]